ncbi:MAG: alanine dehydrogenase [Bacteroidales bacterium]|jgi:alanine dehydrogenase|nr:alanine dehydrogenase [Bacteroidales bacterium]
MTPLDKQGIFIHNSLLFPQEELLEITLESRKYKIGIPADNSGNEYRVPLAPLAVEQLKKEGFEIIIEKNAGKGANFTDSQYAESGAVITPVKEEVFKCDIILKIFPLTLDEIDLLTQNQVLITSLLSNYQEKEYFLKLINKKVTAIAFGSIQDESGSNPIVRSMSEIAGKSSILIAAEYLSNIHKGKGEMLGGVLGVSPTEVVIVGAGTAGTCAAQTACSLGAMVKVFDNSLSNLSRLQECLGTKVFTSTIHSKILMSSLKTADVVIGAIRSNSGSSKVVVTEEMVMQMKKNSIIIDISIDQGGIVETSRPTTHKNPVFTRHGVMHYCVPNIASRVARTASYSISNNLTQILLKLHECGSINYFLKVSPEICKGVYIFNGVLTDHHIGLSNNINARDINLLLAAM